MNASGGVPGCAMIQRSNGIKKGQAMKTSGQLSYDHAEQYDNKCSSHVYDDDGDYDSPTTRDETPDFMKNKRGQRSPNKKRPKKPTKIKEGRKKKMREKERRDNVIILFPHLCFKVAPLSS